MKKRIERGTAWWEIRLGFGRIQTARADAYTFLPDSIKRAQIVNPEASGEELFEKATIEERITYRAALARAYAVLTLDAASDWDPGKLSREDYIDTQLPEDVGNEIYATVSAALAETALAGDEKKT